jgi:hypothetical protein
VMDDGSEFHTRAAATGKAQSPSVERRVAGTTSAAVDDSVQHVDTCRPIARTLACSCS